MSDFLLLKMRLSVQIALCVFHFRVCQEPLFSVRFLLASQGVPSEPKDRAQLLWTAITDYVEVIKSAIRGKYDKRLQKYFDQDQCLTIGSCIRHEYTSLLEDFCDRSISDEITDKQVETAIRLHEGESLPGFPSPDTFEHLILPYLKRLSPPVMDCLGERPKEK